jgi:hypothetical protein
MATSFMSQKINVYPEIQLRQDDEDMYYDTSYIMNNEKAINTGLPVIISM